MGDKGPVSATFVYTIRDPVFFKKLEAGVVIDRPNPLDMFKMEDGPFQTPKFLITDRYRCCTLQEVRAKRLSGSPLDFQCQRCGTKEDIAREDAEIERLMQNHCIRSESGMEMCVEPSKNGNGNSITISISVLGMLLKSKER